MLLGSWTPLVLKNYQQQAFQALPELLFVSQPAVTQVLFVAAEYLSVIPLLHFVVECLSVIRSPAVVAECLSAIRSLHVVVG